MEREEIVYSLDAEDIYSEDQIEEPSIEFPKTNRAIYRIGPGGVYGGCMGESERKFDTPGEWTYIAPPDQDMDSTQVPVWDGKDWILTERESIEVIEPIKQPVENRKSNVTKIISNPFALINKLNAKIALLEKRTKTLESKPIGGIK